MIYKLCRKCKKTIVHPQIYCKDCMEKVIKQTEEYKSIRNSKYNKSRDPKYKSFYNSTAWKLLKEKKRADEQYRCERCHKLATEVHHIKWLSTQEGWERRLDYTNLESLCIVCHNYRHDRFQKKNTRGSWKSIKQSNKNGAVEVFVEKNPFLKLFGGDTSGRS